MSKSIFQKYFMYFATCIGIISILMIGCEKNLTTDLSKEIENKESPTLRDTPDKCWVKGELLEEGDEHYVPGKWSCKRPPRDVCCLWIVSAPPDDQTTDVYTFGSDPANPDTVIIGVWDTLTTDTIPAETIGIDRITIDEKSE